MSIVKLEFATLLIRRGGLDKGVDYWHYTARMRTVSLSETLKCGECSHEWVPRKSPVYRCPKCFSYRWNEAAERREEEQAAKNGRAR